MKVNVLMAPSILEVIVVSLQGFSLLLAVKSYCVIVLVSSKLRNWYL